MSNYKYQVSDDEAESLTRLCSRFIGNKDSDFTFDPLNNSSDAFYLSLRMGLSVSFGDFDSVESARHWIVLRLKMRELNRFMEKVLDRPLPHYSTQYLAFLESERSKTNEVITDEKTAYQLGMRHRRSLLNLK